MELSQEEFEQHLMTLLLQGDHPVLSILRQQYAAATVTLREFSGVGFFTHFSVPDDLPRAAPPNFAAGDVAFQLEGLYNGGGCVLFVRDGKLDFLEGYAYDEPWPEYLNVTGVQYVQPAVPPAY